MKIYKSPCFRLFFLRFTFCFQRVKTYIVSVPPRIQKRLLSVPFQSYNRKPELVFQQPQHLRAATPRDQWDAGRVRKGHFTITLAGEIPSPETRQSNVNPNQLNDITNSSTAITKPLSIEQSSDYSDLTSTGKIMRFLLISVQKI